MFDDMKLKMEEMALRNRWHVLMEKMNLGGNAYEIAEEIQELQRDVDDLERRTNDRLKELGLRH